MRIVTNAPRRYDYGYVEELEVLGQDKNGNAVRLVDIPEESADYQTMRYQSGLYIGVAEERFEEFHDVLGFEPWRGDEPLSDDELGEDRESYTDDQDRESYTEEDRTEVRT